MSSKDSCIDGALYLPRGNCSMGLGGPNIGAFNMDQWYQEDPRKTNAVSIGKARYLQKVFGAMQSIWPIIQAVKVCR